MDLSSFKEFVVSLSQLTRLNFEVWDAEEGLVFFSKNGNSAPPPTKEIQNLSAQVISGNAFQEASYRDRYTLFGAPIRRGEEVKGAIIAYDSNLRKGHAFDPGGASDDFHKKEMAPLLANLSGLIEEKWASQEESKKMTEEMTRQFEDLYLYSRLASQIKTLRFSNVMLKNLLEELLGTMRIGFAFAVFPERVQYNAMYFDTQASQKVPSPHAFVQSLLSAIPRNAPSLKDNYFIVNDSTEFGRFRKLHPEPFRFLTVKVQHAEKSYGWLGLVSFNLEEIFRRSEMRLLISIAEQVAVVIANTDLYRDLENFVINVVKSLVFAIEAKDHYTRGHSERVNLYSMLIAERLQLEEGQRNALHWASILHDIGKIGIPEMILNKTGRLTDTEYEVIKNHPKKGHEILRPLEQLAPSLHGIIHHHEAYDGKGYPDGLKGEDIPLQARIIAVADTFDAITSDRAYRSARSHKEALEILDKVAGKQLDPRLVEVFKGIIAQKERKH
jgi:HD-GYP domain-containing protein (c-di-GMP phosphodiesterase class II)